MQFNLTFNKPAAVQYFSDGVLGLKVKVQDGTVLFKGVNRETGPGIYPLASRTRGGVGITLGGNMASQFLGEAGLDRGTHLTLEPTSYKWLAAEIHTGPTEKPSKLVPTARLWRIREETGNKADIAPVVTVKKVRTKNVTAKTTPNRSVKKVTVTKKPKVASRKSNAAEAVA